MFARLDTELYSFLLRSVAVTLLASALHSAKGGSASQFSNSYYFTYVSVLMVLEERCGAVNLIL